MHPRLTDPLALLLAVGILATGTLAITLGSVHIGTGAIWDVVQLKAGLVQGIDVPVYLQQIVWDLRMPRVVLAALVGAALSLAGVAVQGLVRNPIADPYVLGVSSGSSVGAAFVLLFGGLGGLGSAAVSVGAFVSGLLAMTVVYLLAQDRGQLEPLRLVLVGVVLSYVFSGLTSFLVFKGDPRAAQEVLFWLLGSFGRARWSGVLIPLGALVVAAVILAIRARALDALLSGDEAAAALGVDLRRLRLELFFTATGLTAVMVAASGAVAFVGLVVPHLTRMIVGSLHRRVLPIAALGGALFMMWVDLAARYLAAPQEIPLGIITSLAGGPLFVVLLRRQQKRRSQL
ncbi:MAG: sugar ABC transporter substrate-binding protein [Micrococcales bacterium]|nr:MAG: sugar ABC transporter substrate-binding protein [Micrococcales bacterium]PIE26222.1 MAG: sugar ABC transporter substrate-binding protein [Micrococcales bacterium]